MSLLAPGPMSRAFRSTRETLAPRLTFSVSRVASRLASVRWADWWNQNGKDFLTTALARKNP